MTTPQPITQKIQPVGRYDPAPGLLSPHVLHGHVVVDVYHSITQEHAYFDLDACEILTEKEINP
jgi:hypothetical protein